MQIEIMASAYAKHHAPQFGTIAARSVQSGSTATADFPCSLTWAKRTSGSTLRDVYAPLMDKETSAMFKLPAGYVMTGITMQPDDATRTQFKGTNNLRSAIASSKGEFGFAFFETHSTQLKDTATNVGVYAPKGTFYTVSSASVVTKIEFTTDDQNAAVPAQFANVESANADAVGSFYSKFAHGTGRASDGPVYYPAAVYSLFANGEADSVFLPFPESASTDAERYFAAAWTVPLKEDNLGEATWKGQVINVIVHTMKVAEAAASQF